jgi:membrane protease YdiL (CAAX protease family)
MDESRRSPTAPAPISAARRVLPAVLLPAVLGAAGLFASAVSERGGAVFYLGTFFTAVVYLVTWLAFGSRRESFASASPGRDVLRGALLGVGLIAVFLLGALVVRDVEVLSGPVDGLLDNARRGILWLTVLTTAVNGVGEELFFRDVAVRRLPWAQRPSRIAAVVLYMLVAASMGVPLLVFAALVIGVATQYEAKRTGALLSPIALHLVWTLGMLLVLPAVITD